MALQVVIRESWYKLYGINSRPLREPNLGMSRDIVQESGLGSAVTGFRAGGAAAGRDEALWLPDGATRIGISYSDLWISETSCRATP